MDTFTPSEGAREWAQLVDSLLAESAEPATTAAADLSQWKFQPQQFSAEVTEFLDASRAAFLAATHGGPTAAFGLYRPRVSLHEALHVRPAQPLATDALRGVTVPGSLQALNEARAYTDWAAMAMRAADLHLRPSTAAVKRSNGGRASADGAAVLPQKQLTPSLAQPGKGLMRAPVAGRQVDFMPIILVPGTPSAIIQLWNVERFLQEGVLVPASAMWIDPASSEGATRFASRDTDEDKLNLTVAAGGLLSTVPKVKFTRFRVLDDPARVEDWSHVCAAFVTEQKWQFDTWYNNDRTRSTPAALFEAVRGFLVYYEEDGEPSALRKWRVVGLPVSRKGTKAHTGVKVARTFWEKLYEFLETHPTFRDYTRNAPARLL